MKPTRIAVGAAALVTLLAGAWCCREAGHADTVIIRVPDAEGFLAVWCRPVHPDVVATPDRVVMLAIPEDGLLLARSMHCLEEWHTERHVDVRGEPVDDVHRLASSVSTEWDGTIDWWHRGAETDRMHDTEARRAWLSTKGVVR